MLDDLDCEKHMFDEIHKNLSAAESFESLISNFWGLLYC